MEEAVDTIPSILNKCLFVSPETRKDGWTDGQRENSIPTHKFSSLRLHYVNVSVLINFTLKTSVFISIIIKSP